MANPVLERFIDRLSDSYDKAPNGNVYKLAQLTVEALQEQEDVLQLIGDWHDVDQAQGTTLDMHGRDVLQDRGQAPDEVYRVLIKSKVLRLMSDGSTDVVIDFIAFILDCDPTEIRVQELWPRPNLWTQTAKDYNPMPTNWNVYNPVKSGKAYTLRFTASSATGATLGLSDNATTGGGTFYTKKITLTSTPTEYVVTFTPPNDDNMYLHDDSAAGNIIVSGIELYESVFDNNPKEADGKTATVTITAPAGPISRTGLSGKQFGTLLNLVIAGGVRAEANFEGSFRMSHTFDAVETSDKGFSNTAQTSGGSLGMIYNPDTDYELPI